MKIIWQGEELSKLPGAIEVRDVMGYVEIDGFRVEHHDNWGDERFPWRVRAPLANDEREVLDEFATFREAVRFIRKETAAPAAESETR